MGKSINKGQIIKIALAAIVFFVLWFIPTSAIGLPNISIVEHRVADRRLLIRDSAAESAAPRSP